MRSGCHVGFHVWITDGVKVDYRGGFERTLCLKPKSFPWLRQLMQDGID